MKKFAVILLLLLLAASSVLAQSDAQEPVPQRLEGIVLEISENEILLSHAQLGEVLVLIHEETVWETNGDIACGDYLYVDCSGPMTLSLPPQISASAVRMHRLEGDILACYPEEHAVLLSAPEASEVFVYLPENFVLQEEAAGRLVVYFDGAITMSLPGKISAGLAIPSFTLQGEVTQIGKDTLLLGEGQGIIEVHFQEGTLPQCLGVGAVIQVTYDGQMTRSLPPQVNALEIVQLSR